jgi:hypothetical protein
MWTLKENRKLKGQQEVRVKLLLSEICDYSYASNASEFENLFKLRIKEIPRTNNYSADLLYRVTPMNLTSVEVWKMTVQGDFNYKMFTISYSEK